VSDIVLRTDKITQRFGGLVAVDEVSIELKKNEIVGIIGPNGAGKTTFFNAVTGMRVPTEGRVYYRDEEITGRKPYQITRLGLARTFQNIRLFHNMTAIENVMIGAHTRTKSNYLDAVFRTRRHKIAEKQAEDKALEVLKLTGIEQYKYDYATSLPYGLQRRLEIARAMASDPEILLFDEPAAGMNEQETSDLVEFIRELKGYGYSILLIEHDMKLVMNICERIYVLDHGALIAEGDPETIKANPSVIEAYLGKDID